MVTSTIPSDLFSAEVVSAWCSHICFIGRRTSGMLRDERWDLAPLRCERSHQTFVGLVEFSDSVGWAVRMMGNGRPGSVARVRSS